IVLGSQLMLQYSPNSRGDFFVMGSRICLGATSRAPSWLRNGPNGFFVVNRTVRSSTFSTVGYSFSTTMVSRKLELPKPCFMIVPNVKTTSSAVRGCPSDHLSPLRRTKVYVRLSGLTANDLASLQYIWPLNASTSTSGSY